MSSDFTDTVAATTDHPPPLIGALLRMPFEAVRDRMLSGLHQRGYDDLIAAHLNVLQYPGPDNRRPSQLATSTRMTKQALNYLLGQLEHLGYLPARATTPTSAQSAYASPPRTRGGPGDPRHRRRTRAEWETARTPEVRATTRPPNPATDHRHAHTAHGLDTTTHPLRCRHRRLRVCRATRQKCHAPNCLRCPNSNPWSACRPHTASPTAAHAVHPRLRTGNGLPTAGRGHQHKPSVIRISPIPNSSIALSRPRPQAARPRPCGPDGTSAAAVVRDRSRGSILLGRTARCSTRAPSAAADSGPPGCG